MFAQVTQTTREAWLGARSPARTSDAGARLATWEGLEVPMRVHSVGLIGVAAVSLAVSAAPARAQNFLNGSAETIRDRYFRLTAAPVQMFGRDAAPDRAGGAFRLGYGITDAFDVEAKSAFFDGVTLIGGDGQFRGLQRQRRAGLAPDWRPPGRDVERARLDGARPRRGAQHVGRPPLSRSTPEPSFLLRVRERARTSNDFTRVHVVPGARFGLGRRVDSCRSRRGIGLNHNSPHYLTAGLALHMPTSGARRAVRGTSRQPHPVVDAGEKSGPA